MSNQKQIASSVPAANTSIDEVLKLIKQHAHGIKKASISIFDREGMKLSLAQEAAARDVGFSDWHDLTTVAKRNPEDVRFRRAVRLLKQKVLGSFRVLKPRLVESFDFLSSGSSGKGGLPRPIKYERFCEYIALTDSVDAITLSAEIPWRSAKYPSVVDSVVIKKSGHNSTTLAFELRHAGSALLAANRFDSFSLVCLARVGDEVVYYDRDKYESAVPDGSVGQVVDFERRTSDASSSDWSGVDGAREGFYSRPTSVVVQWEGGQRTTVNPSHIGLADQAAHNKVIRPRHLIDCLESRELALGLFVAPRPARTLYRGDKVSFAEKLDGETFSRDLVVSGIFYAWDDKEGVGHACCDLKDPLEPNRYQGSQKEVDLCLLERGNESFWMGGEFSKLTFDDLQAEVSFYIMVGVIRQVKNKRLESYEWEFADLNREVLSGRSLFGRMQSGLFGGRDFMTAYEVPDSLPDLAARVRERFLHEGSTGDASLDDAESDRPRIR